LRDLHRPEPRETEAPGTGLRTWIDTPGGMLSFGLALEKTGAAGALGHAIVANFQWAGANLVAGHVGDADDLEALIQGPKRG
jgi:hypothetical protein